MSDAFLTSELTLDIRKALGAVDRLNESVHRATTDVRVTVDARQVALAIDAALSSADTNIELTADGARVTTSIDAAVEAADTQVEVEGEARRVTGAIDAAVEAADTTVEIAAQAGRVTGAIDAAVEAADTTVNVDGSVDPGLERDASSLDGALAGAAASGGLLAGALAGLSVAAAGAGLFALADAASELEQSVGGTEAVFGDAAEVVSDFAVTAASMAGLTETAARTLTSQIGGLLKGFGFTKAEAAATSVVLAQLGADLAATFGGSPAEAVEALGGALRGEFNPLERFGVSLNVASINAYALAQGMAASEAEVTIAIRAQAALQLIMERTADAQGQFNRELQTAGGVMSVARASFGNLAAEAGRHLLPALIELVGELTEHVGPGLMDMADQLLPSVSDAIQNLTPLLGVGVDVLGLMAPLIAAVADGLALIPDEAIAIGGALLIANKGFGALSGLLTGIGPALGSLPGILRGVASATPAAASGVGAIGSSLQGAATGLAALNPLVVAGAVFAGGLFAAWQSAREEARRWEQEIDELTGSLEEVDGQAQLTTDGLAAYVEAQSALSSQDAIRQLGELGISFRNVATLIQQGTQGRLDFIASLREAGDVTAVFRDGMGGFVDAQGNAVEMSEALRDSLIDVGNGMLYIGETGIIDTYDDVAAVTEEVAKRQIELLTAQKLVTDEQVRTALGMNDSGEATLSYAEALNTLEPKVLAAARAQQEALAAGEAAAAMTLGLGEAISGLSADYPDLAGPLVYLQAQQEPTEAVFLALAQAIDKAALSEEDMAAMALVLGSDVETMTDFVDTATGALQDFANSAIQNLPTVADAFKNVGEDGVLSAREFTNGLKLQTQVMRDFQSNLRKLTEGGFTELAGIIAEQGPEVGGALAGEMAKALEDGHETIVQEAQDAVDTFQGTWEDTTDYLRTNLGPEFILTTGLIGTAAAEAFGDNLDLGERLRIANDVAELEMEAGGRAVAALAATAGANTAREYGAALDLDEETIAAAIAAGEAIKANAPTGPAREAGDATGQAFVDGVDAAFRRASAAEATRYIEMLERRAREAAESRSPSQVWARLGGDLTAGLVLGLTESIPSAVAATRATVQAMTRTAAAVTSARLPAAHVPGSTFGPAQGSTGPDMRELVNVLASAMPAQLAGDIIVHNPVASTAEASVARELQSLAVRV